MKKSIIVLGVIALLGIVIYFNVARSLLGL